MIVDFHTHSFPDKIAGRAMAAMVGKGGMQPFRDGTLGSLKASMKTAGVDVSVVLPVATSPSQVASINALAASLNGKDGIVYAGAIHPDCDDVDAVLDAIRAAGLFGIKLHPDYQGTYFDDPKMLRILDGAARRGLITVTHAGLDPAYADDIHCTPDRVLTVLDRLAGVIDDKLVLAHLGGLYMADEVLEKLVGKPVYLDTAVVLDRYPEKTGAIIRAHGTDKVLFATDTPWADQKTFVELFSAMGFSREEEEQMFHGNAQKLLGNLAL